jgi:hypothetical protein
MFVGDHQLNMAMRTFSIHEILPPDKLIQGFIRCKRKTVKLLSKADAFELFINLFLTAAGLHPAIKGLY